MVIKVVAKLSLVLSVTLAVLVDVTDSNLEISWFNQTYVELQKDPRSVSAAGPNVSVWSVRQKLDNFDPNNTKFWSMRFIVNNEFYKTGGPLFIFVGGEWPVSAARITDGLIHDMARQHNAFLAIVEHRFYGESRPVADMTADNLQYLNAPQALADLAHFIRVMKAAKNGMNDAKIILVGASYSGALVTWFKQLYPNEVAGVWASSASVLAKLNYVENKEITGRSIHLMGGESCYNIIKNSIRQLEQMVAEKRFADLKALLNICNGFNFDNELDVWNLFNAITKVFSTVVQNHKHIEIQITCHKLSNEVDELAGFVNFIKNFYGIEHNCKDFTYRFAVADLSNTEFGQKIDRQWAYQLCNEFGWFASTDGLSHPFGNSVPLQYFITLCKDVFGEKFNLEFMKNQIQITNNYFGGIHPVVRNVYLTQGQLDPWRAAGIQEQGKATVIPMVSHCKDLSSISAADNIELEKSKITTWKLVTKWLKD